MRRLKQKNMLSKAAFISLLLLFFSCSRYANHPRSVTDFNALQNSVTERFNLLSSNNIKLKFSTVINLDGKDNKLSGKILIYKDTCIFINVISTALGIEVGQARFTRDSVLFVNKIDKRYFSGQYAEFVKLIDINFQSLFSILTDSYIRSDSLDFNSNKAFYFPDNKRFMVNDLFLFDGIKSYVTTEFNQFGNIEKMEFKSGRSNFITVNYSNFVNYFSFPEVVSFSTTVNKEKFNLNLKITTIEVLKDDIPVSRITSLENYSRISL